MQAYELRELVAQVRRLEVRTRGLVNQLFAGQYQAAFKGRGLTFTEVRPYQPGDEVRAIDWNVSARMGETYVKVFEEEREQTLLILLDVSASLRFGSRSRLKAEAATEIAALLTLSALQSQDRTGLVLFSDRIERFLPPRKGRGHGFRILRELVAFRPEGRGTDLAGALEFARRLLRRRSIVLVLSDGWASEYGKQLRMLRARHDVVFIRLFDPREAELEPVGWVPTQDLETGRLRWLDTLRADVRRSWARVYAQERIRWQERCRRASVDAIEIDVSRPFVRDLVLFFRNRSRRP
ncbi:MAG: DUF58 domain-containing protein [Bacteroidetes bacterium]|nr:DUF58 domain-containing protein [Rhodothermia bacterium]MCS7154999.1 DUF58 domain-containing protein [Bacteroidota bacterium]MCX7907283.1 DUF58 domain-containing protein [Bacteroidota bacterium]MDW8137991.1 DUF58 domain-containing protein [Bacteroidota bacterium]MDW8286157.1 DUF58 domain-containing protein [Bacteroidota bacterium]